VGRFRVKAGRLCWKAGREGWETLNYGWETLKEGWWAGRRVKRQQWKVGRQRKRYVCGREAVKEGWRVGIEDLGSKKGMLEEWIWRKEGRVYREGEEDWDVERSRQALIPSPPPPQEMVHRGFSAPYP
jgi:hypothetical protein